MLSSIIVTIILVIFIFYWKNRPIKNSHKVPQKIELKESALLVNDNEKTIEYRKGHNLFLERKLNGTFHLYITLKTNNRDLRNLKRIVISWNEWKMRMYNFTYNVGDDNIAIENNNITIDIGSFNNCNGSKNFLKRTYNSDIIKFNLLDYIPKVEDYEWEKDEKNQSSFIIKCSKSQLKNFKKGVHFIDS
jgi:hypothetical protein